jgi:hypothetical protein
LAAQLIASDETGAEISSRSIAVPLLRKGVFEKRFPVNAAATCRIRVRDPVTGEFSERRFDVAQVSPERRSGVRDERLQREIADETRGRSYDLTTVSRLPDDLQLEPVRETVTRSRALWCTPLWFSTLVVLMLGEWFGRKLMKLT